MIGQVLARMRRRPVAPAAESRTRALLDRRELARYIGEHLQSCSEAGGHVGLLALRLGLAGAGDTDFDPAREDLALEAALVRMHRALRRGDAISVLARNEVCVVVPGIGGDEQAELVAAKLLVSLAGPVESPVAGAKPQELKVSIGIVSSRSRDEAPEVLVRHAREGAIAAAELNPSYLVVERGSTPASGDDAVIAGAVRGALREREFTLHYQPQLDLVSGVPVAAEALARWTRKEGGPVSPAVFVPIIERAGLVSDFTQWTINAGVRQIAECLATGTDVSISVNISAQNLAEHEFPELVAQALSMWSVPAERLTLELTESRPLGDPVKSLAMLRRLKAVGVRLAIDDFGTGYSSLALLRQMPVDELKVDRQFVDDMLVSPSSMSIVRSVLALARNFGLKTVAEGVENAATLDALRDLGCTLAQGYHVAKPMAAEDFIAWNARCRSKLVPNAVDSGPTAG